MEEAHQLLDICNALLPASLSFKAFKPIDMAPSQACHRRAKNCLWDAKERRSGTPHRNSTKALAMPKPSRVLDGRMRLSGFACCWLLILRAISSLEGHQRSWQRSVSRQNREGRGLRLATDYAPAAEPSHCTTPRSNEPAVGGAANHPRIGWA